MAKRHNKICTVCGKHYQYCSSCAQYDNLPLWKSAFCSERCMNIFDISGRYNFGEYSKEKAKGLLDKLGVSKDSVFLSAGINKTIKEVYGVVDPIEEAKEEKSIAVEEIKVEEEPNEVKKDSSSKKISEEKNKVSEYVNATKKRNYRKNKE